MNSFKRLLLFIVIIATILPCFALPSSCEVWLSGISAKSAVVIEADSKAVLYAKNADEKLPMASTTKIMTALVALENTDINDTVSVDRRAVGIEGSSVYLTDGELLTMEELLYAMLLESANDAAVAIAIEVGGSIESFASMMNEKAAQLGLTDTHFENPHGLDGEEHYTTATELALITAEAMKNDAFLKIVSTQKEIISAPTGNRYLTNHNKLLRSYEGAIGVKTGFTKKSGRCLVSAAERDGMRLIAVTINAPDDWNDHRTMLDAVFSAYHRISPLKKGEYTVSLPIVGGTEQTVLCQSTSEISALLPKNATASDCVFVYELPHFLYAEVKKGDKVGKLSCYYGEELLGESDIVAVCSVSSVKYKKTILERILGFFASLLG